MAEYFGKICFDVKQIKCTIIIYLTDSGIGLISTAEWLVATVDGWNVI